MRRRVSSGDRVDRRSYVIQFTHAIRKLPLARSHTPEIEPERRNAFKYSCLRGSKDHFRVHGPAVERVRMANHCAVRGSSVGVVLQYRFESTHGA